jgi:hypothetical protein
MFSRNPREDAAWPSREDLMLKLAWVNAEIEKGSPHQEALTAERNRIAAILGVGEAAKP